MHITSTCIHQTRHLSADRAVCQTFTRMKHKTCCLWSFFKSSFHLSIFKLKSNRLPFLVWVIVQSFLIVSWWALFVRPHCEWSHVAQRWGSVLSLSSVKTILSGIISIVCNLRNVFLKCLVSLTTMKSCHVPSWEWSGQRIMIEFICSLSLMSVLYFLVEYWGEEHVLSGYWM